VNGIWSGDGNVRGEGGRVHPVLQECPTAKQAKVKSNGGTTAAIQDAILNAIAGFTYGLKDGLTAPIDASDLTNWKYPFPATGPDFFPGVMTITITTSSISGGSNVLAWAITNVSVLSGRVACGMWHVQPYPRSSCLCLLPGRQGQPPGSPTKSPVSTACPALPCLLLQSTVPTTGLLTNELADDLGNPIEVLSAYGQLDPAGAGPPAMADASFMVFDDIAQLHMPCYPDHTYPVLLGSDLATQTKLCAYCPAGEWPCSVAMRRAVLC